jgi:DNA-binding PadR family transcriptional regulator
MKKDVTRGHLDLLLLAVFRQGPAHGYSVITALRTASRGTIDLAEGSVYPALHRLEDSGLLVSEWQPVGGRRRRIYRLTPAGIEALKEEQSAWRALAGAVDSLLHSAVPRPAVAP